MESRYRRLVMLGLLLSLGLTSTADAETLGSFLCPKDPHRRAGYPEIVHRWAVPTETPHYCYGYVGGGAAFGGDPRTLEEGTWAMDYCGYYLKHRVWLNWYHGRRDQGGQGKYETDGPHIIKKK